MRCMVLKQGFTLFDDEPLPLSLAGVTLRDRICIVRFVCCTIRMLYDS